MPLFSSKWGRTKRHSEQKRKCDSEERPRFAFGKTIEGWLLRLRIIPESSDRTARVDRRPSSSSDLPVLHPHGAKLRSPPPGTGPAASPDPCSQKPPAR